MCNLQQQDSNSIRDGMTGLTSNIEQVIERFKLIRDKSKQIDFSEALVLGVNAAKGSMQFRIFNKGLDNTGNALGKYKGRKKPVVNDFSEFLVGIPKALQLSEYEKKRLKKGRQIRYKDLEFEGALRRGIVVIKESQDSVVCAIPNAKLYDIAKGQEKQIGTVIFALSEEERELLRTNVIEAVNQIYVRLFNSE